MKKYKWRVQNIQLQRKYTRQSSQGIALVGEELKSETGVIGSVDESMEEGVETAVKDKVEESVKKT